MKEIITSRIEKLKREIEKFFEKDNVGLDEAEVYLTQRIGETVRELLSSYPMGWSPNTLKKFVPILAAGQCTSNSRRQ